MPARAPSRPCNLEPAACTGGRRRSNSKNGRRPRDVAVSASAARKALGRRKVYSIRVVIMPPDPGERPGGKGELSR